MIAYKREILDNGLTVLVHRDRSTPMAAVNLIYKVGSKNESPNHTGFAHLFEHLMFGGTPGVPDFDVPVQLACGENNAFTNSDYTNYYMTLPKANLETAFWLESDRMQGLAFDSHSLEVQRKVVIEEFNQRYLNQPYGDLWLLLRPLVYRTHPYRWSTIGMTPDHIREAQMEQVRAFFTRYYTPANAILSVAADEDPDRVIAHIEKWFGAIPGGVAPQDCIPQEAVQTEARVLEVVRDVPVSDVTLAFHMGGRTSREFYVADVLSDLLSSGTSSRLYRRLVKERRLFSDVNGYVTGELDPGLLVVTGYVMQGVSVVEAEAALWGELERLVVEPIAESELQKVYNKFEAGVLFGEINVMDKAMNLGFYELLGDASLVNREVEMHNSVTGAEIAAVAHKMFTRENSSTLRYLASEK